MIDTPDIILALQNPVPVEIRGSAWTFIDVKTFQDGKGTYYFGRMSKYSPDAEVAIVDPAKRTEIRQQEPNLSIASSPFVYIPEYSGIVYLHVSNHIEHKTFISRWNSIIRASLEGILVDCEIEPITDLRSFSIKLKNLDGIYALASTVSPPNPLFGPLWKDLKEYLDSRGTGRMKVAEESTKSEPLETELPEHVEGIVMQTEDNPYTPEPLPIGDAAILMAADGYGSGYVKGKQGEEIVIIRTSETVRNFQFSREPEPEELYRRAAQIFRKIQEERHMEHL
jgi:hypothetical protein